MSTINKMTAKLKYLLVEYKVSPVVWIESDARTERIYYKECIVDYLATEECFYCAPGWVLRKYNASRIMRVSC